MRRVLGVVGVLGVAGAVLGSTSVGPSKAATRVERGRYLVQSIGCGDCHTPKKLGPNGPEEDHGRLLSGHPEGSAFALRADDDASVGKLTGKLPPGGVVIVYLRATPTKAGTFSGQVIVKVGDHTKQVPVQVTVKLALTRSCGSASM